MDNRPKQIAALVTLLLTILIIVLLWSWKLSISLHKGQQWPPVKEFEIIAEEMEEPEAFVSTYNSQADDVWEQQAEVDDPGASDVSSDADTQTSYDLNNSGTTEGHHVNNTTSERPAPVQEKKVKEGTTKPDDAAKAEAARQQKSQKNIENKLANRFSGAGKGEGGKADPKADGSKSNNGPGGNEPLTYSASSNERPRSTVIGTIRVRVTVLEGGVVQAGSAKYAGGTGNAAIDESLRNECIKRAEKCRFSRRSDDTAPREGIITFKWE
ncbi:MAG: hypothetical protein HDS77_01205 [Bacteroidales bacterium]|nr:hypothetical protein [Bacteroidales bacterium]